MTKRLRTAKWPTMVGFSIAIMGIIVPIVWDRWKSRANVELKQLEQVEIIKKRDDLKKLRILYGNEELENLTRIRFILSNRGTKPIVADDLIKPPTIAFKEGTKILDTKIEAVYPGDLEATVTRVDKDSSIQLRFPLLNQGDNITFSILIAGYSETSFDASARIVGVEKLSIVRKVSEPKRAQKFIHWSVILVGAFSVLLLLAAGAGATDIRPEMNFKRALKEGQSIIPPDTTKEHLLNLLKSKLSWTLSSEREPVLQYIKGLSDERVSEEDRDRIEELVRSVTQGAMSNMVMVPITAVLGVVGTIYITYQLL